MNFVFVIFISTLSGLLIEATPSTSQIKDITDVYSRAERYLDFSNINSTDLKVWVSFTDRSHAESIPLHLGSETLQVKSPIDFQKEFVFIIHGYMASGRVHWMTELASAYRYRKEVNVFLVDWGSGAIQMNYATAAHNTKAVAKLLSGFINYLIESKGVNATSIHIIGHSLGAHIAGFVGKAVPNIGRITGLDPARPLFGDRENRLKQSDALHVDIVHTNCSFLGCGIFESIGDVDFFLNGGQFQHGCPKYGISTAYYLDPFTIGDFRIDGIFATFILNLGCSHLRSIEYFIESIWNPVCPFVGYRDKEAKHDCSVDDEVSILGLSTFKYSSRGNFYINTNPEPPYCMEKDSNGSKENGPRL